MARIRFIKRLIVRIGAFTMAVLMGAVPVSAENRVAACGGAGAAIRGNGCNESGKKQHANPRSPNVVKLSADGVKKEENLKSLAEIYQNDFKIGSVFARETLTGEAFSLIRRHFNVLTAGNAMKPASLTKAKDEYDFDEIDQMLKIIHSAGIEVHGHTLAWHAQSADWLNVGLTRAEAEGNLKKYIGTVAGHFKGRVISWDVLNEGIEFSGSFDGNWRDSLRKTPWYIAFGNGAKKGEGPWDYVEMLFHEARKADPGAVLYYNDYNLNMPEKADAVQAMVKDINDRYQKETGGKRLLIEGIGMQGHYSIGVNPAEVEESIKKFVSLGVQISISELDVGVPGASPTGLTEKQEKQQAIVYAKLFQIYKKYSKQIARVTFWGIDDATSWRSENFPLLFHGDLSPKQAYYAVADPDGYLAKVKEEGTFVQCADVGYGTPSVDGGDDPVWKNAKEYPVTQQLQAWNYATGTMRLLWDEKALYVLVTVNDSDLDDSSSQKWEQDSVEFFVSETDNRKGSYGEGDGQYRVNFKNVQSFASTDGTGFQSAAKRTGGGYVIEAMIPFNKRKSAANTRIGFDVQINDASGGSRKGVVTWNDATGSAYNNTSVFGEAVLHPKNSPQGSSAAAVERKQAPRKSSASWIVSAVLAVLVAAAVTVARVLHKKKE